MISSSHSAVGASQMGGVPSSGEPGLALLTGLPWMCGRWHEGLSSVTRWIESVLVMLTRRVVVEGCEGVDQERKKRWR